jgi:pimeloyl-ACP methyl ester carboxylesterase
MKIEILNQVKDYLNGEGHERFMNYYVARSFTGSITIYEDGEAGTFYIEKGNITNVELGEPADGVDLGFGFSSSVWDRFGGIHRSSNRAKSFWGDEPGFVNIGEAVRARQFNGTVAQICRIYSYMREGIAPYSDLPEKDPDPSPERFQAAHVRGFYIVVNDVKIYVETNDGPTDKAVIMCLHTAGRDNRQYHELMEIMADKYRMYAPDMPAHGKSWPLPGNDVIKNHVDYGKWITSITAALGVENPVYIGCSMAGGIQYHLAQEYNPRAVVCMQGCDNTYNLDKPGNKEYLELLLHPGNNVAATQKEFSDSLIGDKASPKRRAFIQWGVETEVGLVKYGDFSETMSFNVSDKMDKITCPVMIIQGMEDLTYTVDMAKGSYDRLVNCKNKRLELIEGYGHFICVEAPDVVADLLDDFISTL